MLQACLESDDENESDEGLSEFCFMTLEEEGEEDHLPKAFGENYTYISL